MSRKCAKVFILKTITWKNRQDIEMTRHQARNKKEELLKEAKEAE